MTAPLPAPAFGADAAPDADRPLPWPAAAVERLGARTRGALVALGEGTRFVAAVLAAGRDVGTWRPHLTTQMRALGVASLPLALLIAGFTGLVLALLASYAFTRAVPLYFVGTLVQKTVMLELAPVLTGLALAGRVGANIAAELGTMRVTEQVDALESLAYDPLAYLAVPRVLAGLLMFPLVVGLAMLVGVATGWLAARTLLGLASDEFWKGVRLFFDVFDVRYGLVKAASFGVAVALAGCRAGLSATGGAQGVGRAATRAVVVGAVLILVLDAFWAVTWLLGRRA